MTATLCLSGSRVTSKPQPKRWGFVIGGNVPRAPKVCAKPGCHELTNTSHCPAHTPKPWSTGAPRVGRRGWAWTRERARQLELDDYTCQQCGHHDTTGKSLEIDHDDDSALRTLCRSCHRHRTQAQAALARWGGVGPPPG